jgi:60S ribosome subunit biogenesis protein NIP7
LRRASSRSWFAASDLELRPTPQVTLRPCSEATVHALDLLAAHAHRPVWIKLDTERSFLFDNSVPKSSLARITKNAKFGDGVFLMSMSDVSF